MSESSSPSIKRLMTAAADLENAEFECDRLALVYRDVVLEALASGADIAELADGTNIPAAELARIAALVSPEERLRRSASS